jgi:hypothetical protein
MAMQSDPIREWRDQYARPHLRVDFEPLPGTSFRASVKPIFPELRIVRAALSPGFLFRDDDLIRDGDDRVGFVVAQGQLTARHLGREIRLALQVFLDGPEMFVDCGHWKLLLQA